VRQKAVSDSAKITNEIKEAEHDELIRFDSLACRFGKAIRDAIEAHNASEAEDGFPPASHYEISVSLSWAVGWHFLDDHKLDCIISDLLDMRNVDGKFVERTPEEDKREGEDSLLRLVGCGPADPS
jgi:hypothetical protein